MAIFTEVATAQEHARGFTLVDDIGLIRFSAGLVDAVMFSPDERYFVVASEHGRLDLNRPESSLRFYRTQDIHQFLSRPDTTGEPPPWWTVTKSTYKNGPNITSIRWLADSSGLAFLAKTSSGDDQLMVADIQAMDVQPLTPADLHVTGFDVRSRTCYVYSALSPSIRKMSAEESQAAAFAGTGRNIESLLFPEGTVSPSVWLHDLSELWAFVEGRRFHVTDGSSGAPLPIHLEGQRALALSPDGHSVVTALTVSSVPTEWETLYPPPLPSSPYRIRAGYHSPNTVNGQRDVSEYVLINLSTGKIKSLTHAPLGNPVGWWGFSHADWSGDGQSIVLSDTFLPSEHLNSSPRLSQPCVAVVDLGTAHLTCLERLREPGKDSSAYGSKLIYNVQFAQGSKDAVTIEYFLSDGKGGRTYHRLNNDSWLVDVELPHPTSRGRSFELSVTQSLNSAAVLVATDPITKASRIVWDPNPELKGIKLGRVSVFHWKDESGRNWIGGLYKPPDYAEAKRYPLVIQNHGFDAEEFSPSGAFPTAFAAQELAAAGFLVLQVRDCPVRSTPQEGPCQVTGYEAAVRQLAADGLVDPLRVGIVGFSRTCYYVLRALTTSKLHFMAASITDGVNEGYLQYILNVDGDSNNSIARDGDAVIGAPPFGAGLQQWLKQSPEFNMDKVTTPLQIVATRQQLFEMWEPYAALRYLNKPVDLLILNSDEHVLTNPAVRMASQGGTVDWFRFWLKNEEDPDPAKSGQNARWRELRNLQLRQSQNAP